MQSFSASIPLVANEPLQIITSGSLHSLFSAYCSLQKKLYPIPGASLWFVVLTSGEKSFM